MCSTVRSKPIALDCLPSWYHKRVSAVCCGIALLGINALAWAIQYMSAMVLAFDGLEDLQSFSFTKRVAKIVLDSLFWTKEDRHVSFRFCLLYFLSTSLTAGASTTCPLPSRFVHLPPYITPLRQIPGTHVGKGKAVERAQINYLQLIALSRSHIFMDHIMHTRGTCALMCGNAMRNTASFSTSAMGTGPPSELTRSRPLRPLCSRQACDKYP